MDHHLLLVLIYSFLLSVPLWLPIVFLAFALGRKKFVMWFLLLLLTAEGLGFGFSFWFLWFMAQMYNE